MDVDSIKEKEEVKWMVCKMKVKEKEYSEGKREYGRKWKETAKR